MILIILLHQEKITKMSENLHSEDLEIKTENYTVSKSLDLSRALNSKDIDELKESMQKNLMLKKI